MDSLAPAPVDGRVVIDEENVGGEVRTCVATFSARAPTRFMGAARRDMVEKLNYSQMTLNGTRISVRSLLI